MHEPSAGRTPPQLGAVVLTGGTAARMGGIDKATIEVGGVTLLERALAATRSAVEVVVVGGQVPTTRPVTWTREDPPGGGPAAGLLAGLDRFRRDPDLVCVLAVDMPDVDAGTVERLRRSLQADPAAHGACLVDPDGRRQPLAAVYRAAALQAARPASAADEQGLAVRTLVHGLTLVEVPARGTEGRDIDTWADLRDLDG